MSPAEKKTLVRRDHPDLSISRHCSLQKLSRSTLYCASVRVKAETLDLMTKIDKALRAYPLFGSRQIAACLHRDNVIVGHNRVQHPMAKASRPIVLRSPAGQRVGLEANYRRPNTRRPHPQRPIYPYLFRAMAITLPIRARLGHHLHPGA